MPVACPWFEPLSKAPSTDRPAPARSPLGAVFDGLCHASSAPAFRPDDDLLWEPCNFGYGRNRCPHFPESSEADAVRFSEHRGRLLWILERNFEPLKHGIVDESNGPSDLIAKQAKAFRATHV